MQSDSKILKPSKLKMILLLIGSIGFVSIGFLTSEKNDFAFWSGTIFFGLCAIVFLIQLFPNTSYLKLTKEGFEVRSLMRSHFVKWSHVKEFKVGYAGRNKMVMYDFIDEHKKHQTVKKISNFLAGSQAGLPDTYGMKAKDLCGLMNKWKFNK